MSVFGTVVCINKQLYTKEDTKVMRIWWLQSISTPYLLGQAPPPSSSWSVFPFHHTLYMGFWFAPWCPHMLDKSSSWWMDLYWLSPAISWKCLNSWKIVMYRLDYNMQDTEGGSRQLVNVFACLIVCLFALNKTTVQCHNHNISYFFTSSYYSW